MKTYTYKDAPLELHGIPFFEKTGEFYRLPPEITDHIATLSHYGRRSAGARLCFRTDATEFTVRVRLKTLSFDIGLSIYGCQSAQVLLGDRDDAEFLGHVRPDDYDTKAFERTFTKTNQMEDITIFLPRNEIMEHIEVVVPDDAVVESPTPYQDIKPILYYGPSITEAGNCLSAFNAYPAIISSRLNIDVYNMGFSGSALGEPEVAEYIKNIEMSLFVYEYEYNAPTVEHLANTHKPFFDIIRAANPTLPILITTYPKYKYNSEDCARRDIVKRTYDIAIANGDQHVYFMDGEDFVGKTDRMRCFMDEIHPNDIGMLRIADATEPVITHILKTEGILKQS